VFHVANRLEDVDVGEAYDATPGSEQPVVYMNEAGERNIATLPLLTATFVRPVRPVAVAPSAGV